jgi:octaprenyl-diphosphate synthase
MKLLLSKTREKELNKVKQILVKSVANEKSVDSLYDYIFSSEGKKLRALIALSSSRNKNKKISTNKRVKLASIIELLHTATLVHDDVVDDAKLRRGIRTVNKKWSNSHSVLIGDYIYSKAFMLIVSLDNNLVLKELSSATNDISMGEILQLDSFTKKIIPSQKSLLRIAYLKTGRLFEAASVTGGIIGGYSKKSISSLSKYGRILGVVFQLRDDLLDYQLDKNIGKEHLKDYLEGKFTLPYLEILEDASMRDKKILDKYFGKKKVSKKTFEQLDHIIQKNPLKKTLRLIDRERKKAIASVEDLSSHSSKNELMLLLEFANGRSK